MNDSVVLRMAGKTVVADRKGARVLCHRLRPVTAKVALIALDIFALATTRAADEGHHALADIPHWDGSAECAGVAGVAMYLASVLAVDAAGAPANPADIAADTTFVDGIARLAWEIVEPVIKVTSVDGLELVRGWKGRNRE